MTSMTVNGEALRFRLDPATPLLWALRDAANLTGAKHGCDSGECGACTVIVDGRAALSCRLPIGTLEGAEIVTIEGLSPGRAHPIQQAWAAEQVSQCGFCEPGMIMAIAALLAANPRPGEAEIAAIPNICRCGTGPDVRRAIARAAQAMAGAAALEQIDPRRADGNGPSTFSNGSSGGGQAPNQ
jgi:isoquinoline 1-oxidoreductase alpha subunit